MGWVLHAAVIDARGTNPNPKDQLRSMSTGQPFLYLVFGYVEVS